ncbi:FeoA family protein [Olsenella phocaeensis]|uniref:FeoA family protein n=1 Tax=Olsenella phocaeensis TaxID=1852385 RepID=UPI001F3C53D0|nr:ferrous iron transport protein A [Olsenella phocaeensis]
MMNLSTAAAGSQVRVTNLGGDMRQLSRLASVGVIPGSVLQVRRNDRRRPLLVFSRDTLLALGRRGCDDIQVEEVSA